MNDKVKRTHVVPDTPASSDAFGSHQRVARAISNIITTETGGKTLGIEGGWGSGKSTVVSFFRTELQKDPNVAVVTIDAWVHEGDPLRRIFLETLILKLRAKSWIDVQLCNRKLQELSRRRKETAKITTPVLTQFSKALGLAAFLVPIGIAYMMAGAKEHDLFSLMLWIGIVFTILPLSILILGSLRQKSEDIWALFVQKTITTETTETIDTPEPTSIEFKTIFSQIATEALVPSNRRLVIVVDNLDRVSATEARSIWSVLRTFLEFGDTDRPDWFEKLWVIVPYDPNGLEAMLQLESSSKGASTVDSQQSISRPAQGFAASFVDKAIQVRFYVAPPVLADWRQYLVEQLQTAFPDHDKDDPEFHLIYRQYVARRDVSRGHPTPRDLILFVNEIGALYRQWGSRFRLSHMAYFAMLRKERQDIQRGLQVGEIPSATERDLLGTDITESLAALYFNVDVERAGQLLLRDPIASAMSAGNAEELKALNERHRGFLTVLEHQLGNILGDWAKQENQKIANAARALVNSGIIGGASIRERGSIATSFRDAATNMGRWTSFAPESAEGLRCLLLINEQPTVAVALANTLADHDPNRSDLTAKEVSQWVEGLLVFLKDLQEKDQLKHISTKFLIPTNADGWLTACETMTVKDLDGKHWGRLQPRTKYEDITATIIGAIAATNGIAKRHLATLKVAKATSGPLAFNDIGNALQQKLQANAGYQNQELTLVLRALSTLETVDKKYKQITDALATQGFLLHHYNHAASQNANEAAAWLLYLYLRTVPAATPPGNAHNSQAGYQQFTNLLNDPASKNEVVRHFVDVLNQNNVLPLLLTVLDAAPTTNKLIAACISELAKNAAILKLFSLEILEKRTEFLRMIVDEGKRRDGVVDKIVKQLIDNKNLIDTVVSTTFDANKAWLYSSMARTGTTLNQNFMHWCEAGCTKIDKERWLQELTAEGDLAELVADLSSETNHINLGVNYLDALSEHANSMSEGKVALNHFSKDWPKLLQPLSEHALSTLRDRLLDSAKSIGGKTSADFFEHYGTRIADFRFLTSDTKVVSSLFSPLINEKNERGLSWLASIFRSHGNFLENYLPAYAVEDLKERVKGALGTKDGSESVQNSIVTIASALGVSADAQPTGETQSPPTTNT